MWFDRIVIKYNSISRNEYRTKLYNKEYITPIILIVEYVIISLIIRKLKSMNFFFCNTKEWGEVKEEARI